MLPARPPGAMGGSCGENDTAFEGRAGHGAHVASGAAPAGAGKGVGVAAAAQPIAHFAAFRPEAGERAEDVAAALLGKARAPATLVDVRVLLWFQGSGSQVMPPGFSRCQLLPQEEALRFAALSCHRSALKSPDSKLPVLFTFCPLAYIHSGGGCHVTKHCHVSVQALL